MSDTNFTPGKWIVKDKRSEGGKVNNIVVMKGATRKNNYGAIPYVAIGGFPNHDQDDGIVEIEADAHLIAAAPDMYKALEDLLERYVGLVECGDCGNWDAEQEEEVIASRKALAKACGE